MPPEDMLETTDEALFEEILTGVQRPSRYIGGEWNQVVKDHRSVDLTFALAYPDVYEIGMSHLGFRILYALLNTRDDTAAERVFCPWPDMAEALRRSRRPLTTLETGTPLGELDGVGFSLQYEMSFTNVLEMLDLAGIPIRSRGRDESDPLIVAGGPVVFNVEPLADFVDLVLVGDGEELLPEFLDRLKEMKRAGVPRNVRIRELARIEGIYAPALYDLESEGELGLKIPVPRGDVAHPVKRRMILDLDRFPFPEAIVVPHGEIVHDRVAIELMRGCPVGCRFCQAGYVYRPMRERHPDRVRDAVVRSVRATGYDSFSLTSLNTGEYGSVHPLLVDLMNRLEPDNVSVSLSSLHASTMTADLAEQVKRVRKSGFTMAPEAGTQRLRDVINKNLTEEQILEACGLAFRAGWSLIKLYFMIGLPTETDADIEGLVDLAHAILSVGRRDSRRRPEITLSASCFIPKAETPFQWIGMDRMESLGRKQERIARRVRRGIRFKHHDCETSFLEAVFSRGDRTLGAVLERAWRGGARFDGWTEQFRPDVWRKAFRDEAVDPERYAYGDWDPDGRLPWQVIDSLVNKKWLAMELRRALNGEPLSVCGPSDCHGCAPFARDCVEGVISETTGRPLTREGSLAMGPTSGEVVDDERGERASVPAKTDRRYRYRARFAKSGRMRYLGHLDLMRALIRGLRRARIPLLFSRGFNPKPKIALCPALPVGIVSEGEYLDMETGGPIDITRVTEEVNGCLPDGIRFLAVREIRRGVPALSDAVRAARYRVRLSGDVDAEEAVRRFHEAGSVEVRRERKGKIQTFDLKREVRELKTVGEGIVRVTLALGGANASVRPDEALAAIFGESGARPEIVREDLLVDWNGRFVNPFLAASAVVTDAERAVC